ncbi:MAG: hypothetical protein COV10_02985 [Candidatus Vogelbacteria bacterium CG10_big_fil_rev_8_21_14_0_10_51_16]|uniref:Uncharacterized protein n=1 Tax=Candidatus Vogelbacteria bacterium CG10_big_fil_rev_8_21_14_0_10_51_16 TaxID=1975045 RepID=A0A2H0REA3_9BACT|nr:MAG: hypothetical protein COV10_02985 [Candidatus Vogelbacteria bacterium CG10_big_fil_rev_8_21_14_0_10_51_16]
MFTVKVYGLTQFLNRTEVYLAQKNIKRAVANVEVLQVTEEQVTVRFVSEVYPFPTEPVLFEVDDLFYSDTRSDAKATELLATAIGKVLDDLLKSNLSVAIPSPKEVEGRVRFIGAAPGDATYPPREKERKLRPRDVQHV